MSITIKDPNAPVTEAQFSYLVKLICQVYAAAPGVKADELLKVAGYTKGEASTKIELFKAAANGAPAALATPAAPAAAPGYYPPAAHYVVNGVKVQVKKGKYGGPDQLFIGGSYKGGITHPKNHAYVAATFPSADVAHQLVLAYAEVTHKCGVCNIKLTDPKSIAQGIGPVCIKKYGKTW